MESDTLNQTYNSNETTIENGTNSFDETTVVECHDFTGVSADMDESIESDEFDLPIGSLGEQACVAAFIVFKWVCKRYNVFPFLH